MADTDRAQTLPVAPAHRLAKQGARIAAHFFQFVRRKECEHPHLPRIGEALRPAEEPLRFGQDPTLGFTAATITGLTSLSGTTRQRVAVGFFGMMGAEGPLPLFITEYVRSRWLQSRDSTPLAFLDLFHHRLVSLFYRAWANSQPVVSRDRPHDDRFAGYISALIGFGGKQRSGGRVVDDYRRFQAHHLIARGRNPAGLIAMVEGYFGVPARLEEFAQGWLPLPSDYCTQLGPHLEARAQALSALGAGARLGSSVYSRTHKFRLVLGPLTRAQMDGLRSDDKDLPALRELVRSYVGDELEWDVRLIPETNEHPPTRLGENAQLGRSSYLGRPSQAQLRPLQDVLVDPTPRPVPSP